MSIVWKQNGKTVSGPEAIPTKVAVGGSAFVRGNYSKPIELQSMGFLAVAEDVAEHRKRFPDVELKMSEGSAIPVIRSLGQKRAYLKAAGWADVRDFR
jgi:hypothetical protein